MNPRKDIGYKDVKFTESVKAKRFLSKRARRKAKHRIKKEVANA